MFLINCLYTLLFNHLIFIPGIRGMVSTNSSDRTISLVLVLYFIKWGVSNCALVGRGILINFQDSNVGGTVFFRNCIQGEDSRFETHRGFDFFFQGGFIVFQLC